MCCAKYKLMSEILIIMSNYQEGDFSFMTCDMSWECAEDMYRAVTYLELWPFFDRDPPANTGYMFWNQPELSQIISQCKVGHSGASGGWTFRQMQGIRQRGWNNYVQSWLSSQN